MIAGCSARRAVGTLLLALFLGAVHGAAPRPSARYRHRSYGEIVAELRALEAAHPRLVEMFDAQSRFGLPSPGACRDAQDKPTPCKQWVLRITNEDTLPTEGRDRPEVFLSGCLHGDEWVGPAAVTELALFMVRTRAGVYERK